MVDTSFVKTCDRLLTLTLVETRKLLLFMEGLGEDFGFFLFELRSESDFDFKNSFGKEEVGPGNASLTYSALFAFMSELNRFLDEPMSIERIDFLENISVEMMRLLDAGDAKRISGVSDKEIGEVEKGYQSDLPNQSLITSFTFGFVVYEEAA